MKVSIYAGSFIRIKRKNECNDTRRWFLVVTEQFLSDSSQSRNSVIKASFIMESFNLSGWISFLSLQKVKKSLNVYHDNNATEGSLRGFCLHKHSVQITLISVHKEIIVWDEKMHTKPQKNLVFLGFFFTLESLRGVQKGGGNLWICSKYASKITATMWSDLK